MAQEPNIHIYIYILWGKTVAPIVLVDSKRSRIPHVLFNSCTAINVHEKKYEVYIDINIKLHM